MPEGLTAAKKKHVRSPNCIALPSGVPRNTGLSADEALRAKRMTPAMWLRAWSEFELVDDDRSAVGLDHLANAGLTAMPVCG